MHYWTGYAQGEKQAYNDIKYCHGQNNPRMPTYLETDIRNQ
jgi:hypothetical protein